MKKGKLIFSCAVMVVLTLGVLGGVSANRPPIQKQPLSTSKLNRQSAPENKTFEFGGHSYDLVYTHTEDMFYGTAMEDTYVDKDGSGMEVSFISGTERLASVHTGKTATENAISVSQGEGKQLAEAYVSPYIDLTEYEYEYRPDIYGHQYDSSRKLIHTHHYVRYINGYKTMDTVSVDLLEDGTLYAISMLYRDSFAHTSVPRIDQDKLQRVIDDYLSQLGISDYTVTSKVLIKNKDGETELYVVYDETDAAGDMFTIAIEAII